MAPKKTPIRDKIDWKRNSIGKRKNESAESASLEKN